MCPMALEPRRAMPICLSGLYTSKATEERKAAPSCMWCVAVVALLNTPIVVIWRREVAESGRQSWRPLALP